MQERQDIAIYIAITQLVVIIALFVFFYFKKRIQVGKTWRGAKKATVSIQDKELKCHTCGNDTFNKREALLNTTWVSFFHLNPFNRSGVCFQCRKCGFLHWFIKPNEEAKITKE